MYLVVDDASTNLNQMAAAWSGRQLALEPVTVDALRRDYLSPSTALANSPDSCQARWVAERLLPRDDDPLHPTAIGTAVHSIAELLFRSPPGADPNAVIDDAIFAVLGGHAEADAPLPTDSETTAEWLKTIRKKVLGLRTFDRTGYQTLGCEERLTGPIAGVNFLGYLDLRLLRLADGKSAVIDIKSGKKEQATKPKESHANRASAIWLPHHSWQVQLYVLSIRGAGAPSPTLGGILYSHSGELVPVDLSDSALTVALERWNVANRSLNRLINTGKARTRPSPWCSQCPIKGTCPVRYQPKRKKEPLQ